nr:hypothetical protein [Tanacetum cinerariifolium]
MWEDFVFQFDHKNQKKSNEMYYPRFTKVIIHHFMSKDPSIPRRNKVNWHYVRDDFMFSTKKLVSRHQNTQQFGALLHIELINEEIKNYKAYKEYYAIATGEAAPKTKASVRRTRSGSDTSITPPTAAATLIPNAAATPRLTATAKGKQTTKASKAKSLSALSKPSVSGADEGTGFKPGVPDVPTDESEEELSWNSTDDEGADDEEKVGNDDEEDEGDDGEEGEEDDDENKDDQEVAKNDDKDDAEESRDDDEEGGSDEEDDDEETRDDESFDPIPQTPESNEDEGNGAEDQGLNIGEEERLNEEEEADELYRDVDINQRRGIQVTQEVKDSHVTLTLVWSLFLRLHQPLWHPLPITASTMTPSTIATITTTSPTLIPPTSVSSDVIKNLPSFGLLFCFDDRLKSLEANFSEFRQTNPFAETIPAILGIVHQYMNQQMNEAVRSVNAQLKAEVLTRSSHSSRTFDAVAADLSEMELKKILIKKTEGNKSIQRSDEQRNLYKALVEAYEVDKIILDTYGETVTLKRRRDDDDADKDEGPSAGPDRGSKRPREGQEPESVSAPSETPTRIAGRSTTRSRSRQASTSEYAFAEEPVQTTSQMEEPSHPKFDTGAEDQPIVQSS